jgi:hypothetical protein
MAGERLQIVSGAAAGQSFEVSGDFMIGRGESGMGNLQGDSEISRHDLQGAARRFAEARRLEGRRAARQLSDAGGRRAGRQRRDQLGGGRPVPGPR